MAKDIIGSDYDDTWTTHKELWNKADVIITGNSWEDYDAVMVDKEGPDVPMFFNTASLKDVNLMSIVNHKSKMITDIGVTVFYENQPEQVAMLKLLCPKTTIKLVKDGQSIT